MTHCSSFKLDLVGEEKLQRLKEYSRELATVLTASLTNTVSHYFAVTI